MAKIIPIEVSARHIHMSREDLERLFGKGYKLKKLRNLNQPGEFASDKKIILRNNSRELSVRIVGPIREKTQVEISLTDAFYLGVSPPFRKSGDLIDTPGIILKSGKEEIKIKQGVIIDLRHIHCSLKEAKRLGVKNNQLVSVGVKGKRGLVFHNVRVRAGKNYRLSMHVDTDEGNAAGINKKAKGYLV